MRRALAALAIALAACDGAAPLDAGRAPDAGAADAGDDGGLGARDGGVPPGPIEAFPDRCVEGQAPDAACWRARRDPSSASIALASAIAERWMARHAATRLGWDWVDAVLVFALTELARVSEDPALLDYAADWLGVHVEAGYDIAWSDHCPPMLSAIPLFAERGELRWLRIVEDVLGYYVDAPRTAEGGVGHLGRFGRVSPRQWLDSLMMVAVPLARWGELANDPAWIGEASTQATIFADTMQDEASGWLVHAYPLESDQTPGTFWARGNGWVLFAMFELLRIHRVRGEAPPAALVRAAERLSAAVIAAQDPATGRFWTVLNRPGETYLETSATALFATGLARGYRYGWLGEDARDAAIAALAGVVGAIRDEGEGPIVGDISGPTTVGTYEYYAGVPRADDLPYGLGAVLLALLEVSGLDAL
ncbi:MAG: glycoside hydrolase family 88 protein [Sandaracinaceae bacterium]|nr:glycoside hydrolase family 88 protein [Sandaracinaceae bacterium]